MNHRLRMLRKAAGVIQRCTNEKSPNFKDYGKRGIKVFAEWVQDYHKFADYLLSLPGYDNLSLVLDRRDNDGHYVPGNLRFVTRSVSSTNRRMNQQYLKPKTKQERIDRSIVHSVAKQMDFKALRGKRTQTYIAVNTDNTTTQICLLETQGIKAIPVRALRRVIEFYIKEQEQCLQSSSTQ